MVLLDHLQQDRKGFQGHWIAAGILEKHIYPELVELMGWQAHPWKMVARELGKLTRKRQKDCRSGAERKGPSPREYLIPKIRAERAPREPAQQERRVAKVA